jgi:AcrR family transcriptional regulator
METGMPRQRQQQAYDERKEQILRGALEVFSTRGFHQATNRDIAQAARINSPGLIYHYFSDKRALLQAVIERYAPPLQLVAHPEALMALPPEEGLAQFSRTYLHLMANPQMVALLRVVLGEALRSREFATTMGAFGPLRIWGLLALYLQRKMDEGSLRRTDPVLAARCFVGPLVTRLMTHIFLHASGEDGAQAAALVAANVDIFLRGMQKQPGE